MRLREPSGWVSRSRTRDNGGHQLLNDDDGCSRERGTDVIRIVHVRFALGRLRLSVYDTHPDNSNAANAGATVLSGPPTRFSHSIIDPGFQPSISATASFCNSRATTLWI